MSICGHRVVCWFSCGAASAVATKLAIAENAGRHPLVVVRCIVREEHNDNDRFAADCERWFGHPITNLIAEKYDGSVDEVIRRKAYISGNLGAPCSRLLKKEVRQRFERPTDRQVFGYTADASDIARWNLFLDANNIDAHAPLIERGLQHADTLAMVAQAGIALPAMYLLGYQHNNCKGCIKATSPGYWNKVRVDFPDRFAHLAVESRRLGARLTRIDGVRIFLDEVPPSVGDYRDEPEVQCGIFCHMAEQEYS
jgi:hypothetical protein